MSDDDPTVLGFVDMRSAELVGPLEAVGESRYVFSLEDRHPLSKFCRALIRGWRVLHRADVDVLVLYNGTGVLGVVSTILSLVCDVPLVIRVNGDTFGNHGDRLRKLRANGHYRQAATFYVYHLLTRLTYHAASAYLTVSDDLRRRIDSKSSYPDRRTATVYNSVDETRFSECRPAERVGNVSLSEKHVLLTVTNLDYEGKYRGVVELLDEVVDVLTTHDELVYVVAGDGAYFDSLSDTVARVAPDNVADRIVLTGYVDTVAPLFAAADVFIYKSYADAYPNVVLEAQAAELPVVANAAYGIEEQIDDGETGILLSEDTDGAYADAIVTLLADDALRRRLGRNAAATVRSKNTDQNVGTEMIRALSRITKREDDRDRGVA